MPLMRLLVAALALLAAGPGSTLLARGAVKTVWDGIFTAEQAGHGAAAYAERCGSCHGPSLQGSEEAPGLAGGEFLSHYDRQTVADLFERVRTTMPQNAPATLSREQYAEVLAFLMQSNGFPVGSTPLDSRSEELAAIAFVAAPPAPVSARTGAD
jgi:mono/diheme cytochrome c family protein